MECREIQERLSAYHDGELPREVAETVRQHLQSCTACDAEMAAIRGMSSMMARSETQATPNDWPAIEARLHPARTVSEKPVWRLMSRFWPQFAMAASVFLAIAIGLLALRSNTVHADTIDMSRFVADFPNDPVHAEQVLLANYGGQSVNLSSQETRLPFRSRLASKPPADYTLKNAYVLQMPCCQCVQAIYARADGSVLCIFEHAGEQLMEFGDRPTIMAKCAGRDARLVQIENHLTAAWDAGGSRMTLVGAKDAGEVVRLVGHFN